MTDRATLAAYVRKHLPEVWDGEHFTVGDCYPACTHCDAVKTPSAGWITQGPDWERVPECPGPDYTQDTDALLRMMNELYPEGWNYFSRPNLRNEGRRSQVILLGPIIDSYVRSDIRKVLLAAALAGIAQKEK